MKLRDISKPGDKLVDLVETSTSGGTPAGSVASVANPMMHINRRPSLFGYIPYSEEKPKRRKKRKA